MDKNQKKELISQWKERRPEMGVMSITCTATGEKFYDIAKDTSTWFNRHRFQLEGGLHRNKQLQTLWNAHGEAGFTFALVSKLEYEDPADVKPADLAELLELCLMEDPAAKKL